MRRLRNPELLAAGLRRAAAHRRATDVGGADDAHVHPGAEVLVDHGTEKNVGIASVLFGHGGHDVIDTRQRKFGATHDVDQQAVGLAGELRGVQQRALLEALDHLGHGVFTGAGAEAEERLAALLGEGLTERGVVEIDQAGAVEHRPQALHTAADPLVGEGEGVERALPFGAHLDEHVVGKWNHGVAAAAQLGEPVLGLLEAAAALEAERQVGKRDHERAGLSADFGDNGSRSTAGAAAHAGDQKDEVGARDQRGDLLAVGLGGEPAELGVATGAEAAGDARADHELGLHRREREGLGVGVEHGQRHAAEVLHLQTVDGIGTSAADTDHLDGDRAVGEHFLRERQGVVGLERHDLRCWRTSGRSAPSGCPRRAGRRRWASAR